MRLQHNDKSVTAHQAKALSPAAQAAFDRLTANLGLSPDEENDVGRRVALAAEAVERDKPHRVAMRQAAEPTREEAAELAAALAAAEPFNQTVTVARTMAQLAAAEVDDLSRSGYGYETQQDRQPHERRLAEVRAAAREADRDLERALEEAAHADKRVTRARGSINRGGQARQVRVVGSW